MLRREMFSVINHRSLVCRCWRFSSASTSGGMRSKMCIRDSYYGVQSLRAAENFHITGLRMHPEIINSLAYIKKAAAITNCEVGMLEKRKAQDVYKRQLFHL